MNRDNFDGSTYDSESDLQMLGFRMYDNETGRFTTPDLLWSAFPAQTPYHYAYNSPLTYRDPTGLAPEKEKEGERLLYFYENEFADSYALEDNAEREKLRNDPKYDPSKLPEEGGREGGNRTGGTNSSGENGQGGDKTTTEDYYNLGISAEDWAKMSQEDKDKALKSANDKAKELTDKTNSEWAYTIFSVTNADGTTSIVVTNFKTDMKSSTVQPDKNFPCDRPEASEVMNSDQVGDGHSHGGSNGDHSPEDLEYMYESSKGDGTVPMDGYTSVVIGSENNYYLTVTDGRMFQVNYEANRRAFIGNLIYNYGSWIDMTSPRSFGTREERLNQAQSTWHIRYYKK